jgi:hypothetical protein
MKQTFLLSLLLVTGSASAGEVRASFGPSAGVSSWRADYAAGTAFRASYKFGRRVSADFGTGFGYGTVDNRFVTQILVGLSLYQPVGSVRFALGAFGMHQHEESVASARKEPVGVVFGVGDGIRHRAGVGTSLGLEVPLIQSRKNDVLVSEWFGGVAVDGAYIFHGTGPTYTGAARLSLGFSYVL